MIAFISHDDSFSQTGSKNVGSVLQYSNTARIAICREHVKIPVLENVYSPHFLNSFVMHVSVLAWYFETFPVSQVCLN